MSEADDVSDDIVGILKREERDDILERFESLAASFRRVGNDQAAREVRDLCNEIRKYGV